MNITFLVGNGFDLHFDLKTSYTDFYNYYCNLASAKDDMIVKSIKSNYENWSDLEMGLAQFVNNLSAKQVDCFIESKIRLEDALVSYLKAQENRLVFIDKSRVADAFRKCIKDFYKELNSEWKEEYETFLKKTNSAIHYEFVTFNYTEVLDKLIDLCKNKYSPFLSHVSMQTNYSDYISGPLHIHGTLSEDLILGIDSLEQLSNVELRNNEQLLNCFVKTRMNKELGERRTEQLEKIIKNSRYIFLYGLSCGDSDQTWWKCLIEWLKSSPENRLIICAFDKKYTGGSAAKKLRFVNARKDYFAVQGMCDKNLYSEIKNRIQIVINSKIFQIEEIQVTNDTVIHDQGNNLIVSSKKLVGAV